jgi:antitoxin YefM
LPFAWGESGPDPAGEDQGNVGRQVDSFVRAYLLQSYGISVHNEANMDTVTVNQFREKLKTFVEQVVTNHTPLKVTRRAGEAFVVMSADDWEREQETLYVLQNTGLMRQIADSLATHSDSTGYTATSKEMDEITGI